MFLAADESQYLNKVTFDMTVHYFDGIPANMNNEKVGDLVEAMVGEVMLLVALENVQSVFL